MKKLEKLVLTLLVSISFIGAISLNTSTEKVVYAQNNSRHKTKLSDKQIIKNLRVIKSTNPNNNAWTKYYQAILNQKNHSIDNPFIKLNPYGNSPLTALIITRTDQAAQVSYKVIGKDTATTITNSVSGYQTDHQIPIVGLYADYDNQVEVTYSYQDGTSTTKTYHIKTGKLPSYITKSNITVTKNDKSKMDLGHNKLTVLARTTKQTFAVDADGQVRWYYLRWNEHIFKQLNNGHLLLVNKNTGKEEKYNLLMETDYLGRIYNEYHFDKTLNGSYADGKGVSVVHHDVCEMPNGNLLLTVDDGSKYVEDTLAELDRKTGKIVKVIDFKKIFPASMYLKSKMKAVDKANSGLGLIDWMHLNDVDYDPQTGNILLSSRNQDMIWAMNYKTKKLSWIFSSKKASSWPKSYRKYLLKPSRGTKYPGGQHALYLLKHNGSKLDVLLYDNNIAVKYGDKKASGQYSCATEYEIDPNKKTIKQLWTYGKSLGKANFTRVIGNAQRLSNENTLIDFGYKYNGSQSNVIEVTPDNQQVFNLTTYNSASNKTYVYRAYRMEFYPSNYHFDVNQK